MSRGTTGPIENIIVVMLENRSYDNVLGWLYNKSNQPPYDQAPPGQADLVGLTGNESNPDPAHGDAIRVAPATATTINGVATPATAAPGNDPGEIFGDMAQQFLGLGAVPETNPYADWPASEAFSYMQGFTANYAKVLGSSTSSFIPDIMTYLTPADLPVTAFLANKFAVCDQWHASVPTQTFTNRAFSQTAAPGVIKHLIDGKPDFSLIDDCVYVTEADLLYDMPSVFEMLDTVYPEATTPNWKVYFHDYSISMMTVPFVRDKARSSSNENVATYDKSDWGDKTPDPHDPVLRHKLGAVPPTFKEDIARGTLPKFSFIEPRYSNNSACHHNPPNSNHPGSSKFGSQKISSSHPPIDTANGEVFLADIYNTLVKSVYWDKTLLIITYDEPGGIYDSVPLPRQPVPAPGQSTPPGGGSPVIIPPPKEKSDPAADGFGFNVLGGRVPTIVVSPYIAAGSTIRPPGGQPFDHTSIVRTVWDCFDLGRNGQTSLTNRDATAPSLMLFVGSAASNNPGNAPG